MAIIRQIFLAFLVASAASLGAGALHIHPQESYIVPGKSMSYLVSNQSEVRSVVRAVVEEWTITADGSDRFTAATDVKIRPSQFFLNPKMHGRIELSWTGPRHSLQVEKPYRITFFQSAMGLHEGLLPPSYATLFVRPHRPKPSIELTSASLNKKTLSISVSNRGNTHLSLATPSLMLRYKDGTEESILQPQFVGSANKKDLHAGQSRHLFIQLPQDRDYRDLAAVSIGVCDDEDGVCSRSDVELSNP